MVEEGGELANLFAPPAYIQISFIFRTDLIDDFDERGGPIPTIPNDVCFRLRRRVAEAFRDCEFGNIVEEENDKFSNVFAIPVADNISPDGAELAIFYNWRFPIEEYMGRINRIVLEQVPRIAAFARDLHLLFLFRFNFDA